MPVGNVLTTNIANLEAGAVAMAYSAVRHGRPIAAIKPPFGFDVSWAYQALQWTYEWLSQKGFDVLLGASLVFIPQSNASPLVIPLGNIRILTGFSIGTGGVVTGTDTLYDSYVEVTTGVGSCTLLGYMEKTSGIEEITPYPYPFFSATASVDRVVDGKKIYTNINWKAFGNTKATYIWGGNFSPCSQVKIVGSDAVIIPDTPGPMQNIVIRLDGFVLMRPCIGLDAKEEKTDPVVLEPYPFFTRHNLLLHKSALVVRLSKPVPLQQEDKSKEFTLACAVSTEGESIEKTLTFGMAAKLG